MTTVKQVLHRALILKKLMNLFMKLLQWRIFQCKTKFYVKFLTEYDRFYFDQTCRFA